MKDTSTFEAVPEDKTSEEDGDKVLEPQKSERKKKQEKDLKHGIRKAFENAKDMAIDCVEGCEGMDIYQYCAFLSKNSYYVAPKSKDLEGGDQQPSPDEEEDEEEEFDEDEEQQEQRESSKQHIRKRSTIHSTILLRKAVLPKYRVTKRMFYLCFAKAILVSGLQLVSLLFAMSELISNYRHTHSKGLCSKRFQFATANKIISKSLFAGYCALIAISVNNMIQDVGQTNLYASLYGSKCILPDLLDQGWLITGRTINYFVLLFSTWASFLIIALSDNVIDMVLNSVAIFFVLQLGNMAVGRPEYKRFKHYLDVYEWSLSKREGAFFRELTNQATDEEKKLKKKEWNILKILFDWTIWFVSFAMVTPAIYLTSVLAFLIAPMFILACA